MSLKEIRELLLLKDWTRPQLAKKLGISLNTVDRWFCKREDQRLYPRAEHVQKMRDWLLAVRKEAWKEMQIISSS